MNNNKDIFDLSNEVIVITGVSGQLGHEYAKCLLDQRATVVGLDLDSTKQDKALFDCHEGKYMFIEANVTDKETLNKALLQIKKNFGSPTVLINNAGIDSNPGASSKDETYFEDYPEETWDKVLDVNLKGIFLSCQIFGKEMVENKKGSIINISSIYGVVSPDQSIYDYRRKKGEVFFKPVAYSASKSGIINLTKYLAVYWALKGIRVNTLTIAGVFNNQDAEFLEAYNKRIPVGRMAEQNEYNGAIIFLSSNASNYMTGSNLIVDGGWTAI